MAGSVSNIGNKFRFTDIHGQFWLLFCVSQDHLNENNQPTQYF